MSEPPKLVIDGRLIVKPADLVGIYQDRIAEHGFTPQTLLYSLTPSNHQVKMSHYGQVLRELLMRHPNWTVLDIGCGFGSLASYLPLRNYWGIDLVPAFINKARKDHPGYRFDVGTIESLGARSDICVLAGVLATVPDPFGLAESALEAAKVGLLCDFNWSDRLSATTANPDAWKFTPTQVKAWQETLATSGSQAFEGAYYTIFLLSKRA